MKRAGGEIRVVLGLAARILLALPRGQRAALGAALGCMTGAAALSGVSPVVIGRLVDALPAAPGLRTAAPYLATLAAAFAGRLLLEVARRYLVENVCTRTENDLRVRVAGALLRFPLHRMEETASGSLQGRANRGVEGYVRLLKLGFLDLFPTVLLAVFALAIAVRQNLVLGLVMAAAIPCGLLIVALQIRSQRHVRLRILRAKDELDGRTVEMIRGVESIRALSAEPYAATLVGEVSEQVRRTEFAHHVSMAWYDAAKFLTESWFQLVVVGTAVHLATVRGTSPGEVITSVLLFASVLAPVKEMHRILDEAHESALQAQDVLALLDEPPDPSCAGTGRAPETGDRRVPAVEFTGVRFAYAQGRGPVVRGLDVSIRSGEFVGICGPSRGGKSTLLKLAAGLVHPDDGEVRLFGGRVADYAPAARAGVIGYVGQHPWLVTGSILDNITYGADTADTEAVVAAAKRANLHEEILAMPDGYDTRVAENGAGLSGGQRQRVVLARQLLRRPRVLLLDEATSALDSLNERAVMDAIEAIDGLTLIAVAHRLATLRRADRILVVSGGSIVEEGTYDSLRRGGGLFARLHDPNVRTREAALVS